MSPRSTLKPVPETDTKLKARRTKGAELELALQRYCQAAETTQAVRQGGGLKDWAVYTAAAGSALAMAQGADADIMYSGVQNITVTRTAGTIFHSTYVDLNGDGQDEFLLRITGHASSAAAFLRATAGAALLTTSLATFLPAGARRLSASSTVSLNAGSFGNDGLMRFVTTGGATVGQWPGGHPTGGSGFAGVGFYDTGGDVHFAWLRLAVRDDAGGVPDQITLVDWAYESEHLAPIHVSTIPEPSSLSLGMLAAGAGGVAAFRRRRKVDASAN